MAEIFIMYYTYILISLKDRKFYIGSTSNLKIRVDQHNKGKVESTAKRRPLKLIYYECYLKKEDTLRNENYYKTTKGREDLKKKIKSWLDGGL